jgi:hypothetical protein
LRAETLYAAPDRLRLDGFRLGLAWAVGRGHRSARIMLGVFLGVNVYGLFSGLAQGSAMSAQADLAIGTALCLFQLAAVVLVFPKEFGRLG